MAGGSMSGKGGVVNTGDLPGQDVERHPAEVRAAIVVSKSGNADGAKGGRKTEPSSEGPSEDQSPQVPATDKQGEEALWQRHKAQRGVWSEKMLLALETGVKGKVWFSLIDKIFADRTLQLAWETVQSNAGACGVDGITVGHFGKDSQKTAARREGAPQARHLPAQAGQTGHDPKTGQQREATVGHTDGHGPHRADRDEDGHRASL